MSRKATDATAQPKDCAPEAENLRFARKAIWSVFVGLAAMVFTALGVSPALMYLLGDFMVRLLEETSVNFIWWILLAAIASGVIAVNLGKGWRDHSDTYNRSLARVGTILGCMAIAISIGWALIIVCMNLAMRA